MPLFVCVCVCVCVCEYDLLNNGRAAFCTLPVSRGVSLCV